MSHHPLADAVDDAVKHRRHAWVLGHLAGEREGRGIEKPPQGLVAPIMRRRLPLLQHIGNAVDVDDAGAIQRQDGVIRHLVGECRLAIPQEALRLHLALDLQRLHDLGDEAGQFPLGVGRVLTPDDVIGLEGQIVTNEDATAEGDADRELLVVAVPQAEGVGVFTVGTAERQEAEVAGAVFGDGVVLFEDLVAEKTEAVPHQLHDLVVSDGNMRRCAWRCRDRTQIVIRDFHRAGMQHQCHGKNSFSLRLARQFERGVEGTREVQRGRRVAGHKVNRTKHHHPRADGGRMLDAA